MMTRSIAATAALAAFASAGLAQAPTFFSSGEFNGNGPATPVSDGVTTPEAFQTPLGPLSTGDTWSIAGDINTSATIVTGGAVPGGFLAVGGLSNWTLTLETANAGTLVFTGASGDLGYASDSPLNPGTTSVFFSLQFNGLGNQPTTFGSGGSILDTSLGSNPTLPQLGLIFNDPFILPGSGFALGGGFDTSSGQAGAFIIGETSRVIITPAPGAAAVLGLGGLASVRRRR